MLDAIPSPESIPLAQSTELCPAFVRAGLAPAEVSWPAHRADRTARNYHLRAYGWQDFELYLRQGMGSASTSSSGALEGMRVPRSAPASRPRCTRHDRQAEVILAFSSGSPAPQLRLERARGIARIAHGQSGQGDQGQQGRAEEGGEHPAEARSPLLDRDKGN